MILLLSSEVPDAPEGRGVGLDEGGGVGLGTALGMGIGEGGGVVLARGFEDRHAQPHAGGACEAEDVGASGRGPMKVSKVMPKVVELALYTHSDGTEEVVKVLAAYVEGSSGGSLIHVPRAAGRKTSATAASTAPPRPWPAASSSASAPS